jgi:hypothetical protein
MIKWIIQLFKRKKDKSESNSCPWPQYKELPPLQDDVVKIIDVIYERNIYTPEQMGFIRAMQWSLPLSKNQIHKMEKSLCPK